MQHTKTPLLITVLLLFSLLSGCSSEPAQQKQELKVTFVFGKVFFNRGTARNTPLRAGMTVTQSDVIRTVGKTSRCNLQSPGGSVFRLSGDTTLELAKLYRDNKLKHEKTGIALLTGKVLVRAKKLVGDEELKVRTKTAVAGVRGTQFIVAADSSGKTAIAVKEGRVRVARRIAVSAPQLDKKQQQQLNKTVEDETAVDVASDSQVVIDEQENKQLKQQIEQKLQKALPGKGQKAAPVAVKDLVKNTVKQSGKAAPKVQRVSAADKNLKDDFAEFKHTAPVKLKPDKAQRDKKKQNKQKQAADEAVLRIRLTNRDEARVTVTPGSTFTISKGETVELRFPADTAVSVSAAADDSKTVNATPKLRAGKTTLLNLAFKPEKADDKNKDKVKKPAGNRKQQYRPAGKKQIKKNPKAAQKKPPKGQSTKVKGQKANIGFQDQ